MFRKITIISLILLTVFVIQAQDDLPDAPITNDEGGPVAVTGEVSYTSPFFTTGVAAPIIILEDQTGFVDRNEFYVIPTESQTLGQITTDFFTSPFSYSLALPIEPQAPLRDVDNDGEEDSGVMVFAVAYWNNVWGDPFLEERDLSGGGWSTAYASTRTSSNPELRGEVIGGTFIVYAPDDQQGFPSGFGPDGLLFTEDDPAVRLPQGYTAVNIDTEPFTFDRSRQQDIDLIEPEGAALVDYSDLGFVESFDAMAEKLRNEYAFTEYKDIDWDALIEVYRPRVVRAEDKDDPTIYANAIREFLWSIPDGHVGFGPFDLVIDTVRYDIGLGIGMGVRTTDDGRVLVTYLLEDGPAAQAGISIGDQIVEMQGQSVDAYINSTISWDQPFSTPHNLRLSQEQYAMRFNLETPTVDITYLDSDGDTNEVTLETTNEIESLGANSLNDNLDLDGFELPVEFDVLDNGYGYASIYTFSDNQLLMIQLWERMIRDANNANLPGLIIDMRLNGGGLGFLADQMTAYFFNEPQIIGQRGFYSEDLGEFYFDPRSVQRMYLPTEDLRYNGPIVILVSPDCASACERFAYNMTLQDRAEIVGQYPTAGLGGSVDDFLMPLGITIRFTAGRSVDADGNIHIEGIGVEPTIDVPVNEETLFSDGDPILEAGIAALDDIIGN